MPGDNATTVVYFPLWRLVASLEVDPLMIGGKPVDVCLMMRGLRWEINMTILPFNPYLSLQKNALGFQTRVLAWTPRSKNCSVTITHTLGRICLTNWKKCSNMQCFRIPFKPLGPKMA